MDEGKRLLLYLRVVQIPQTGTRSSHRNFPLLYFKLLAQLLGRSQGRTNCLGSRGEWWHQWITVCFWSTYLSSNYVCQEHWEVRSAMVDRHDPQAGTDVLGSDSAVRQLGWCSGWHGIVIDLTHLKSSSRPGNPVYIHRGRGYRRTTAKRILELGLLRRI